MLPSAPLRSARLLTLLCLVPRLMADRFVLTLLHPDLIEAREVAVEDVEVDAVDEAVSIAEDAVADVVALLLVEADEGALEVAEAEGRLYILSQDIRH